MEGIRVFSLLGIPVRITLTLPLILFFFGSQMRYLGPLGITATLGALVLTILVHEFGHAIVARHYRLSPAILLHGWGGLCFHERAQKDKHDVFIISAGPLLEIAVGLLVMAVVAVIGRPEGADLTREVVITGVTGKVALWLFIDNFIWYSIIWGLVNLVPLWPLDGGQLFRLAMLRVVKPPAQAERVTHLVGIGLSVTSAVLCFAVFDMRLFGAMSLLWGFENFRHMRQGSPAPVRIKSELATRLLPEANAAAASGDWREARRLAFQARDEKSVTDDQLLAIHQLITIANAELGEWTEVLDWERQAGSSVPVLVAVIRALCALGRHEEARRRWETDPARFRATTEDATRVAAWLGGAPG